MNIKHRTNVLFIVSFLFAAFSGYSRPSRDISFTDITSAYKIMMPHYNALKNHLNAEDKGRLADVTDFRVAIIPLELIGKIKISWNDNQQQMTKETELEFETDLLSCSQGKEGEDVETKKRKTYCWRSGYGDAAMRQIV